MHVLNMFSAKLNLIYWNVILFTLISLTRFTVEVNCLLVNDKIVDVNFCQSVTVLRIHVLKFYNFHFLYRENKNKT